MKRQNYPEFPLTISFLEDGDKWVLDNEEEVAVNLEWFNSEDPEEKAIVKDKKGRPVKIIVESLEIKHISST